MELGSSCLLRISEAMLLVMLGFLIKSFQEKENEAYYDLTFFFFEIYAIINSFFFP